MARWIVRLCAIAGLGAIVWLTYRQFRPREYVQIRTVEVSRGPLCLTVTATGRLAPTTQVLVGCEVSGTVGEIFVNHNDRVKKGQVIARLKPELFQAEHEQANAELARAQATLRQLEVQEAEAKRRFERIQRLQAQNAAGDEEYRTLEAAWKAATASTEAGRAAVRGAQNAVDLTKYRLGKTEVISPIDGIVLDRRVDVGQTVAAALMTPELFVLAEDLSRMDLLADVSEADVGYICPGQQATFTVNAYRDREFSGTVRQIRNQPHTVGNVVTYAVVIEVANNELLLRPGMPADISLEVARQDDALKVPNAALRFLPPIPPDEMRRLKEKADWPPTPEPIPVAGDLRATSRPDEVSLMPPPIQPGQGFLWRHVNGAWTMVPVWTGYSDNRETILYPRQGVEEGMTFVAEYIVSRSDAQSEFQKAILMTAPENRRF
ncbi:MAG TPA: efflux RND transporter periplasmic adaptor subunit [Phycisphaerae bacterium]|nr:efflux RND transporter periplasmic adaptor subunit [Phycisphaerae bacterium]